MFRLFSLPSLSSPPLRFPINAQTSPPRHGRDAAQAHADTRHEFLGQRKVWVDLVFCSLALPSLSLVTRASGEVYVDELSQN